MTTPPKYEDLVLKVAELERREAALREELNRCGSMAAMIEEKEWAEHAGSGPVSSRVESAFTQLHNELAEAQQRLTVAEKLLREIRQSCELSKLRDAQIDAALNPAAEGDGDDQ